MISLFILGLPRTGTTYIYKYVCSKLKNTLCLFEPFNGEVVSNYHSYGRHFHDKHGEVPSDYNKLPKGLFDKIYQNSLWINEWRFKEKPSSKFLGNYTEILSNLNDLREAIVIKDVVLWIVLQEIYENFNSKFILTIPSYDIFLECMKKRYQLINTPVDKAGVGKFYKYYTGKVSTFEEEVKYVFDKYIESTIHVSNMDLHSEAPTLRVAKLEFSSWISDRDIDSALKKLHFGV